MTTASVVSESTVSIDLERIYVDDNVRELDLEHVDNLAASIKLVGQQQPVLVVPATGEQAAQGFDYELTAGAHRHAAVSKLADRPLRAIVDARDAGSNGADVATTRAVENIARKQLNPYEEAIAVKAMLDRGMTPKGAAEALTWSQALVAARVKLLELPEKAQVMVGAGVLPLASVDALRAIGTVSPDVLELVIDFLAENPGYVDYLHRDVAQLLRFALREMKSKVFVAVLTAIDAHQIEALKVGKKLTGQYDELAELHKQANPYSGRPTVRFADAEVDQARAAGVLIEGAGSPLIVDKSLYRELVKQAIKRTREETQATHAQRLAQRKTEQAQLKAERATDPETELRREHGRTMRAIAETAHGANTDLGWGLRNGLASVDPANMDVARFFVYALLDAGYSYSSTDADSDRVTQLATTGIRLVIDEFREDVTKTKKDGTKGAFKIAYGANDSSAERAWLWKFIEGAKTAGDLYGRALVVIAAEHYASRLVLPMSRRRDPLAWSSRQGKAVKALEKLAGPHVPVSLKQLQKAVVKANAEYDAQLSEVRSAARKARAEQHGAEHVDHDGSDVDGEAFDDVEDLDDFDDFDGFDD